MLYSEPVFNIFEPLIQIDIYTDACLKRVGTVLKRKPEKKVDKTVITFQKYD